MLAQGNPDAQKAVKRLVELSADDRARMIDEARLKLRRDKAAYGRDQYMKGWEEGWKEGREESQTKFARKLLQHSYPLEEIVGITGLSMQNVRALQSEVGEI